MALLPQAGAATARPPVEFGRRAGRAATGFAARVLPGPESPTAVCSFCGRDLWEAGRYVVAQFAAICEECIATASSVLETAEVDQTGATDFPPRLYGRAPDGDAVEQVVAALQSTFASPSPELPQCEDAEELAPLLRQLSRDRSRRLLVTRVRFLDSDRAEVAFSPAWGPGVAHAGSAIRTDGVWYVTRATVISTLRSVGIVVPPPPSAPAGPEP
ncbi:MAG: ClpX C4-type zinc finger protein [Acidimicrobiales bacterium]